MTDLELFKLTDGLSSELVPVPGDADEVCPICRSWRHDGACCRNCADAKTILEAPCLTVIPICLYAKPSPMRDRLKFYKAGPLEEQARYRREVAGIVDRFFLEHGTALRDFTGGWDAVSIVPSTKQREAPHPLERALLELDARYVSRPIELLTCVNAEAFTRRKPSDDAFAITSDVEGKRILVLDDVYTTGARSQSAASALARSGASVPAIVVIGRRINPDYKPQVRAIWDRQRALRFKFTERPWWAE